MVVLPPLICCALSLMIFMVKRMELDRFSAVLLCLVYFGYLFYSIAVFGEDLD